MKTPLANKAALAIIRSVEANPALQFDATQSTAQRMARVIAQETAADDLLQTARQYRHLLSELHGGNAFSKD